MGSGIRWAQQIAEARIARQLEQVDGLDTKAGLIFAYASAVLIGSPAIGSRGEPSFSFFLCALAFAGLAILLGVLVLYPRKFNDPPNAATFARDVGVELVSLDWALRELMRSQVRATEHNNRVIGLKLAGMRAAIAFAVAATLMVFLQVVAKEGYAGG